jgi:hypothetical protein
MHTYAEALISKAENCSVLVIIAINRARKYGYISFVRNPYNGYNFLSAIFNAGYHAL